jgi:hypothetical protein
MAKRPTDTATTSLGGSDAAAIGGHVGLRVSSPNRFRTPAAELGRHALKSEAEGIPLSGSPDTDPDHNGGISGPLRHQWVTIPPHRTHRSIQRVWFECLTLCSMAARQPHPRTLPA